MPESSDGLIAPPPPDSPAPGPAPESSAADVAAASGSTRGDLRLLLVLAAPNVASMVAETLLSMTDFWIVSHLGSPAQAAVSSAAMIFLTIFGLLMGTMSCVNTVVSQSFGARRLQDCSAYAWQGVWISFAFGLLGFALWPVVPWLYGVIGHAPDVQQMEISYTRIRLLSVGAAGACIAVGQFFNGIQRPRTNTASVVVANVINAVLSYGLVFGRWGLPQLGFDGAAVGTVISVLVRLAWLVTALWFGRAAGEYASRQTWRLDADKVRRLIKVGWPSGVQFVLDIAAWATFLTWIIGRFGTVHLAATATCWRFTELSFMPAVGIGYAISALVGEAIGQGRPDVARRRVRIGTIINMAYMGCMAVVFVVYGEHLMRMFSREPDVIAVGAEVLVLAAVFQLFDAVAISYSLALRGAGDTLWSAVVIASLGWTIMIGGGRLIAGVRPEWGTKGPWAFAAAFVIVVGIVLWARWQQGHWEKLDVIGRPSSPADGSPVAQNTLAARA